MMRSCGGPSSLSLSPHLHGFNWMDLRHLYPCLLTAQRTWSFFQSIISNLDLLFSHSLVFSPRESPLPLVTTLTFPSQGFAGTISMSMVEQSTRHVLVLSCVYLSDEVLSASYSIMHYRLSLLISP